MSATAETSTNMANDFRVPASDNEQAALASAALRVISPPGVPGESSDEQHGDLSRALFGDDLAAVQANIPSQHLCPIIQEPPFDAVHFNVPNANGVTVTSQQVYEKSALYRAIATPGILSAFRNFVHPLTRVPIARNRAWDYVHPVNSALREILHRERLELGLLLEDDNPLTEDDRMLYQQTMRLCESRSVIYSMFSYSIFLFLTNLSKIIRSLNRNEVFHYSDVSSDNYSDSSSEIDLFDNNSNVNRPRSQVQQAASEDMSGNDSVSLPPTVHASARSSSNREESSTLLRGSRSAVAAGRGSSTRTSVRRVVNGSRRRQALGGFVWDTPEQSGIRDSTRASALVGILQLAEAHPQGFMGSLANNNRSAWFCSNSDILFQDDGPLGSFTQIRYQLLQRHFGVALRQAKEYYTRNHSSEQSGAGQEEIPAWARSFFRLFDVMESNPSASAQAAEVATNRRIVVNSIMGRQAPLGPHERTRPVQLRGEVRDANDNERVRGSGGRQQDGVGNFETETLDEGSFRERLVEGVDDTTIRRPAQRQRTSVHNGTRRRNRHDPSADANLPNSRYFDVSNAFQHLGNLTDAIAQAFVNPPPPPPRTMSDIMNDFSRASDQLYVDEQRNFQMGITFWTNVLNNLVVEQANLAAIVSDNVSLPSDDHTPGFNE
jgi:hypothetical protein